MATKEFSRYYKLNLGWQNCPLFWINPEHLKNEFLVTNCDFSFSWCLQTLAHMPISESFLKVTLQNRVNKDRKLWLYLFGPNGLWADWIYSRPQTDYLNKVEVTIPPCIPHSSLPSFNASLRTVTLVQKTEVQCNARCIHTTGATPGEVIISESTLI